MRRFFTGILALFLFTYGVDSFSQGVPEVLYYRFHNNTSNNTPNYAVPGRGSVLATNVLQSYSSGGQFDTCLSGAGGTNKYQNTGWATNLGTSNWTISLWIYNVSDQNPTYLFGDVTTSIFRCFCGGAAGPNNLMLRSNSFQEVLVTNVLPGPTVIHFVYNGSSITVYKNGVYYNSFPRSGINLNGPGPFKVAGYGNGANNSLNSGGKIDEFRVYSRALTAQEISVTWNKELGSWLPPNAICKFGINKFIPDPGTLYDTINVNTLPGSACITSVMLRIDTLIHPNDGDLVFNISHGNTTVTFINRAGGNGSNFLKTNVSDTNLCYIGSSGCDIAPFAGSYRVPSGDSLARFKFQNPNGPWVLSVNDMATGNSGMLKAWCIVINYFICTGISGNPIFPKNFSLEQNYPNPFNPNTRINYSIPKATQVTINVYDVLGNVIKELVNERKEPGVYNVNFDGSNFASGVYYYRMTTRDLSGTAIDYSEVRKMSLVK